MTARRLPPVSSSRRSATCSKLSPSPLYERRCRDLSVPHHSRAEIPSFPPEVCMTYIAKPRLHHPKLPTNALGFTHRDYEGAVSTLCAGCGHDSISAAIIQACFELALPPHKIAKLSGIG